MRKVILSMHISLDGFVAGPNGELDWVTMDEDMDNNQLPALMERADTCLIGRSLYEGFAGYWPTAPQTNPNLSEGEVAFSKWIDQAQKVVFSTTLESAEWNNSRVARGSVAEEVARLKQQPGKDMLVFGGARFAQELVRQGLVDEYDLMLSPVILGQGMPLFHDVRDRQNLTLVACEVFAGKAVSLRYVPAENRASNPLAPNTALH